MPWRETSPMDQRLRFIADYREGLSCLSRKVTASKLW
jgi:hypothetical protein